MIDILPVDCIHHIVSFCERDGGNLRLTRDLKYSLEDVKYPSMFFIGGSPSHPKNATGINKAPYCAFYYIKNPTFIDLCKKSYLDRWSSEFMKKQVNIKGMGEYTLNTLPEITSNKITIEFMNNRYVLEKAMYNKIKKYFKNMKHKDQIKRYVREIIYITNDGKIVRDEDNRGRWNETIASAYVYVDYHLRNTDDPESIKKLIHKICYKFPEYQYNLIAKEFGIGTYSDAYQIGGIREQLGFNDDSYYHYYSKMMKYIGMVHESRIGKWFDRSNEFHTIPYYLNYEEEFELSIYEQYLINEEND